MECRGHSSDPADRYRTSRDLSEPAAAIHEPARRPCCPRRNEGKSRKIMEFSKISRFSAWGNTTASPAHGWPQWDRRGRESDGIGPQGRQIVPRHSKHPHNTIGIDCGDPTGLCVTSGAQTRNLSKSTIFKKIRKMAILSLVTGLNY